MSMTMTSTTKAEKESAETFMANVEMLKAVQLSGRKGKTSKGEEVSAPLDQCRDWVEKDLAVWADPRPDL